jgi:hypothetical protein
VEYTNKNRKGFAFTEIFLWILIVGLMVGAVFGGVRIIQSSKIRSQVDDLRGLSSAVYTFYDKFQKLPGDKNSDGEFDNDGSVWDDLKNQKLIQKKRTSPYGGNYAFGFANKSMTDKTYRQGNFVSVSLPLAVAKVIDIEFDDGEGVSGIVTATPIKNNTDKITLFYFLD